MRQPFNYCLFLALTPIIAYTIRMQYTQLPHTDITVSRICFGCWALAGGLNWGDQDDADSHAALNAAFDAGITFFDTAEAYGDGYSEHILGKTLGHVRDDIVIATKVSVENYTPEKLRTSCENSLRQLNTSYIDLYQLHWPHPDIPVAETLETLLQLQSEGKIRAFGVSNFPAQRIDQCAESHYAVSTNQVAYNLLFRAIEFGTYQKCAEHNIGLLCYSPIMQGILAGRFPSADDVPKERARTRHFSSERPLTRHGEPGQEERTFAAVKKINEIADTSDIPMADLSMAWLLHKKNVTALISGGRNARQAIRNATAADVTLTPDIMNALDDATEDLRNALGANMDMWEGMDNSRSI